MNSCEQQCIWGQDLQVIGWVEELAILSSTSSFLHVVVARHNSVADGERETEGGWKYNANVINFKLPRTVMTYITSKGQYFNRYDSPNVLLTIKKRQGGRFAIYFFWYFRLFCFFCWCAAKWSWKWFFFVNIKLNLSRMAIWGGGCAWQHNSASEQRPVSLWCGFLITRSLVKGEREKK